MRVFEGKGLVIFLFKIDKIQRKLRNEHPNNIITKNELCSVLSVHPTKQDHLLPVREYEEARGL
jgi:hypothetical protein